MMLLSLLSSFWGSHVVLYIEDWDVLLLISQERVEVKIAGGWRRAVGGCSSPKAFPVGFLKALKWLNLVT